MPAAPAQDPFPITLILSISSFVFPILFGFVMWKMSQTFVPRTEFLESKIIQEKEMIKLTTKLEHIDTNIMELLQRTATLRQQDATRKT